MLLRMQKLKFYKEKTNKWYVDLPDWNGTQEELEMVGGADTMLDIIAQGNDKVILMCSTDVFDNSDALELKSVDKDVAGGAFYFLKKYKGIDFNMDVWLCSVCKFVFGDFPDKIYFCSTGLIGD